MDEEYVDSLAGDSMILSEPDVTHLTVFNPDDRLLDLLMPDMDGIETFKRLKKELAGQVPPVIVLTSISDSKTETECLRMGAMDFVQKPFTPEILVLRVLHVLELAHLQKNLTEAITRNTPEK